MGFGDIFRSRGDQAKGKGKVQTTKIGARLKVQPEISSSQLDLHSTPSTTSLQSQDLSNPEVVTRTFANLLRFNSTFNAQPQVVKRPPKTIVVENTNSYWNVEVYGGVKVWVNSKTGDVSVENPLQPTTQRRRSVHSRRSISNMTWKIAGQMDAANTTTVRDGENGKSPMRGSVYFNPDMKELMDMLDGQSSRKISKAVHHRL